MYSVSEVARMVGVSPSTVRRWSRVLYPLVRTERTVGQHRRYRLSDVRALALLADDKRKERPRIPA